MMTLREQLTQDWLTVAIVCLCTYVVTLSVLVPGAGNNTLFRTLAQAVVLTAFNGIALAYHYRSDKVKQDEIERLLEENRALRRQVEGKSDDDPDHH